jgi:pyridoxine 4-dehydrogenase
LNWTICKGTLPIPGAKDGAQAQENAGALGWRLTDDEMAQLDQVSDGVME